jgi:glyoxylate reductase/D-3-phosphoglycerate dehydrogenase
VATKIVVSPKFPAAMLDIARSFVPAGFEIVVVDAGTPEFTAALADAAYYVGFPRPELNSEFFKAASGLKLVQLISAGYDRLDVAAAKRAGVPVANNGGSNSVAVAEHTLMLMLAVYRKLSWHHGNVITGKWRVGDFASNRTYELEGKTLGIIGLGTIGKKVARLAQAFGMTVHYYDIVRLKEEQEDALGVRFRLLPEILRTSDIISLHVPLNDSTHHLLGAQELAVMKKSAIIVNTSRGPVIDEKAMTAALSAGKLFGAGLDVFDEEPTPPDNPLLKLENVVLTAHLAGPTWESNITRLRNGFDNVQRVARGESALWVVPELL